MAAPTLRLFGVLTDDGDTLYGFHTLSDLLDSQFGDDDGVPDGSALIRIDAYTVLAEGSDDKAPKQLKS